MLTPSLPLDIVAHPRFGSQPMVSGQQVDLETIKRGHWQYADASLFPQSVLAADVSRQNFALYPRVFYVDMLVHCRECQRPFLFFAKEQQHWYEELGFYVDADCVHCPVCRKKFHRQQALLKRYGRLVALQQPTRKELMQLVDDTVALLRSGHLKNTQRLSTLIGKARRLIPEYPGVEQLRLQIVATEARQKSPTDPFAH